MAAFKSGRVSAAKLAAASDREAMRMLCSLKGIGDWSATSVLINFLHRADMIMYADLTTNHALTLALALTLILTLIGSPLDQTDPCRQGTARRRALTSLTLTLVFTLFTF